jgi:hypothetical protein
MYVQPLSKTQNEPLVAMEEFDRRKTQSDLEDYLENKGIDGLFLQITESVLLEKPDNVVGFMAHFLRQNYPAQMSAVPEEKNLDLSELLAPVFYVNVCVAYIVCHGVPCCMWVQLKGITTFDACTCTYSSSGYRPW